MIYFFLVDRVFFIGTRVEETFLFATFTFLTVGLAAVGLVNFFFGDFSFFALDATFLNI